MSKLTKITILLASFFAVDKVLAITRQLLTARIFGLSAELDAFNAANNLPDLLFALISGGALAIAFIPVLSEILTTSGRQSTWLLFSRIANLAFIVTAIMGIFIAIFAEPLVSWRLGIAPGFDLTQQKLVAELMRLNLIATLIFSISGLVMAGLQTNQHFLLPAIAPLLYNLGQIFGALILAPKEGLSIWTNSVTCLQFGCSWPGVWCHYRGSITLTDTNSCVSKVSVQMDTQCHGIGSKCSQSIKLLGPRLLTMLFIQLIFIARDNLASGLSTGAVSALTYGWMIMQVPETLLGTAIGTALLPTLSEFAVKQQWSEFTRVISRAVRILTALTIPIFIILSLGLRPLISLAFGFDAAGTDLILNVSRAFLFGLIAHSIIEVGVRSFYSIQNAKIPLLASAVTIIVFLIFGNLLVNRFGAVGIAASVTIAFSVEMVLIMILLIRRFRFNIGIVPTLSRAILASIAGSAVLIGLSLWLPINPVLLALVSMGSAAIIAIFFINKDIRELRNL